MLYVDVPTLSEFKALHAHREDVCVSIYLETTPLSQHADASRIALGNLMRTAVTQLTEKGVDKNDIASMTQEIESLQEDYEFWRLQAHSLAIFVTPTSVRTFRLPNKLTQAVQVSDRFHLKPLLRSITFKNSAFVLALSENAVRLVEVFADLPATQVPLSGAPEGAGEFLERDIPNETVHNPRIQAAQGEKVRLAQYARAVDNALRPILAGRDTPLVLAAAQPLVSIFKGLCSYPGLTEQTINKSPDRKTDSELAEEARPILDQIHADEIQKFKDLYQNRVGSGRGTTDLSDAARAATYGAIEALLVDIDEVVNGELDETTGAITFSGKDDADNYDVIDEIVARALTSGAKVLGVRRDDIPNNAQMAAILRYPV